MFRENVSECVVDPNADFQRVGVAKVFARTQQGAVDAVRASQIQRERVVVTQQVPQ